VSAALVILSAAGAPLQNLVRSQRRDLRRRQGATIAARLCFGSMKTFKELLGYIAAIGLLVLGLAAGGVSLITPETTMKAEAKAPIVPQKFLDSIERKKPVSDDVVTPDEWPCR
jgi:hypothetical protein